MSAVARAGVAPHGVGSVGVAVQCGAGQAEECEPEQRRDDGIVEVFGERFDDAFAHLFRAERGDVAADQPGQARTPSGQRLAQGLLDGTDFVMQHAPGQQRLERQAENQRGQRTRGEHCVMLHQRCQQPTLQRERQRQHEQRAQAPEHSAAHEGGQIDALGCPVAHRRRGEAAGPAKVAPNPDHRVPARGRLAQAAVDQQGQQQGESIARPA